MKKSLLHQQYQHLLDTYIKLNKRLEKHFASGRFITFAKGKQVKLIQRLARIKAQLLRLESGLKLAGTAMALGTLLYSSNAQAQFAAVGSEFKVNNYTTSDQRSPSIATNSNGDYVITWMSYGQDGDSQGIYAQRYNAGGTPQGSEFRVNTYTSYLQASPSIAMDSDGDFVIAWISDIQDGSYEGIYAQRYNATGTPQGSEFRVNTYITNNQAFASVAMDNDGNFVITWQSATQDGSSEGIYAKRYDAAGTPQGSEFRVNTYTTNDQSYPSIAMDSDGDFVITWQSAAQEGSLEGIYAQRYNAAGTPQGSEFHVNTYTTSSQLIPSVAMDDDGDFVITWQTTNQDGSLDGIYAQRYNAAGVAQGSEFRINTYTTGNQRSSIVAMDSDGDFVVTWQSYNQTGDSFWGAYGQRFNAAGVAQGSEFHINTHTTNNQWSIASALDNEGDFVVTWESNLQDGSLAGIYAQRYTSGTATALQKSSETSSTVLYPNPAKDHLFVSIEGEVNIKVLDLSGHLIKEAMLENKNFNIVDLKTGVYMIELTKDGVTTIQKLLVE
jgi:hypothetical protein